MVNGAQMRRWYVLFLGINLLASVKSVIEVTLIPSSIRFIFRHTFLEGFKGIEQFSSFNAKSEDGSSFWELLLQSGARLRATIIFNQS